jgi:1-acyl-sn-glycerol-3-phosphate acyltransferase
MTRFVAPFIGWLLVQLARLVTGARAMWIGSAPRATQRVYFANHNSHIDFILIWASIPSGLRATTRPVAGSDYWLGSKLRTFLIREVFHAVLIDRERSDKTVDPIQQMTEALSFGDSIIVFPEGTRNLTEERLLPFKSGIYHLAKAKPEVEFVPVWIENLGRVMPKGETLPVPLLCTVSFGAPIHIKQDEDKRAFLDRARDDMLALAPPEQQ